MYVKDDSKGTTTTVNGTNVYVVDARDLISAARTAAASFDSSFKEGGYNAVLTALDNTTELDLTTKDYSNVATGANSAISTINDLITALGNSTADGQYKTLRDAMNYEGAISDSSVTTVKAAYNNGTNPDGYTSSTYNAFVTAYEAAKAKMAALYSTSGSANYSAALGTEAQDLLDALVKTLSLLLQTIPTRTMPTQRHRTVRFIIQLRLTAAQRASL